MIMRRLRYILGLASIALLPVSCNPDSISPESVITLDEVTYNQFDKWLKQNYVDTYNISFRYRYEEIEADYAYYTVPAKYENCVMMAHILKHVCLEAYDEVADAHFIRAYFPKLIHCTGQWLYRNNGTFLMGSAEGGRKINLDGLNYLDEYMTSAHDLNYYYIKTIHHEFTHILNQTRNYPASFQFITGTNYIGGVWSDAPYNQEGYYLSHGFVSAYAQQEHSEDFAEMLSIYVTYSESEWDLLLKSASQYTTDFNIQNGTSLQDGAELILAKLDMVKAYMKGIWSIDLDELRNTVHRRQMDILNHRVDLTDVTTY